MSLDKAPVASKIGLKVGEGQDIGFGTNDGGSAPHPGWGSSENPFPLRSPSGAPGVATAPRPNGAAGLPPFPSSPGVGGGGGGAAAAPSAPLPPDTVAVSDPLLPTISTMPLPALTSRLHTDLKSLRQGEEDVTRSLADLEGDFLELFGGEGDFEELAEKVPQVPETCVGEEEGKKA